jgi:site-specific DNA-methyltransferase (adenine-specific)
MPAWPKPPPARPWRRHIATPTTAIGGPTIERCPAVGHGATIALGDCLELLRTLPAGSVDAVVTDPPYSSGGAFRGDRMKKTSAKYQHAERRHLYSEFSGDNRDQRSFAYWCVLWLSECLRIARPGSPICVFTDWRQLPTTTDAIQAGGWVWRGIAPWDKTGSCRPQMGRFAAQCEYVVWGSKGAMAAGRDVGCLPGVFRHPVRKGDKFHIAGKPSALMAEVARICPPGGTILDPFAGSGSTGLAALGLGMKFIGFESDPVHFATASRRLRAAAAPPTPELPRP